MMDYILLILILLFLITFIVFYNNYLKNIKKKSHKGETGYDSASKVVKKYDIDSYIIEQRGSFNDNYNYNKKVIKLSSLVYHDDNIYSVAMGYFISMQAVLDKENNSLYKIKKFFEPLYYILITLSYIGIILLAFSNLDVIYPIVFLSICLAYQIIFLKSNLDIINRIKKDFIKSNTNLTEAVESLYLLDMVFGVLYIKVLIDKLIELIKNR